jgi:phosphate/sulfate permease
MSVLQMHEDAEKFDPRTEQVFKVLQVISACAMSFAHGANDIANSIGSFSAAYYVYQNMAVPGSNAEVGRVCVLLHCVLFYDHSALSEEHGACYV